MPLNLPPPEPNCPDPDCRAPLGAKHLVECDTAICVTTGQQRILHDEHLPLPDDHICGQDVWTGHRHGVREAYEHNLFVRAATADDHPLTGWIPCGPGPDAVADLHRVASTGRWNPDRQRWDIPAGTPGHG